MSISVGLDTMFTPGVCQTWSDAHAILVGIIARSLTNVNEGIASHCFNGWRIMLDAFCGVEHAHVQILRPQTAAGGAHSISKLWSHEMNEFIPATIGSSQAMKDTP